MRIPLAIRVWTAFALCLFPAQATAEELEPASKHRLSLLVAPIGKVAYIGDFGPDNPPSTETNFLATSNALALNARYGFVVQKGLELGASFEYLRPYSERTKPDDVRVRHEGMNAMLYIRPHMPPINRRFESGGHGRIGLASGRWGSNVTAGLGVGLGFDVRFWLSRHWAIGAELSGTVVVVNVGEKPEGRGGPEPVDSDAYVNATGFVALPLLTVVYAP